MNAVSSYWRRLAVKVAQHATCVMPGARSPWADAMRRELDYIENDPAALRWALGCMVASYRARLTHRPSFSVRVAWRHVATSGVLMLLIGLALQDHAGGQTQPPRPAFDETICDPPEAGASISAACSCRHRQAGPGVGRPVQPSGAAGLELSCCGDKTAADVINQPTPATDTSCADRIAPIRFLPKNQNP
jgi:hypothetical protein